MDKEFKISYVMTYSWESIEEIVTARSHTDFSKPGSHSVRQDPERYNHLRIKDQGVLLFLSFRSSSKGGRGIKYRWNNKGVGDPEAKQGAIHMGWG